MGLKWETTLVVRWNRLLNSFFLAPQSKFFFSFFHFHYNRQLLFLLLPHFQPFPTMPEIQKLVQSLKNDYFHQKLDRNGHFKTKIGYFNVEFALKWSFFNKNGRFRYKNSPSSIGFGIFFIKNESILNKKWNKGKLSPYFMVFYICSVCYM